MTEEGRRKRGDGRGGTEEGTTEEGTTEEGRHTTEGVIHVVDRVMLP